ncbi:flagellar hook-associated protein FlgK [Cytobacillus sp. FJAT-53684]|uniref:Flagellar hook-associated protein 1 n=1 Tax=Cytobacillus mangrovibacter TaxID=3299024 RepID=A0ABW6JXC2_9BACI
MRSTFQGLEIARRGINTQQAALYTTGHNIANANTPGYTRQRVNFLQTEAFPSVGFNRPQIPGQMGTGVQVGDVQRIRDSFVDMQFRNETSKLGYWQAKAEQTSQMENIMNEPSDTGLASTLDQFWNSLQDLAVQPQNNGARRVVRQRGISVADTFNYMHNAMKAIQKDYRNEINVTEQRMNSLLRQINQVNKQIGSIEPHGYLPNDLYDQRDRLVDELSSMVNVKIEPKHSGGVASANAEGLYDIYLATPQGEILRDSGNRPIKLIDSSSGTATGIHIQYDNRVEQDSPVAEIKFFELKDNEPGFKGLSQIDADNSQSSVYKLSSFSQLNTNGNLKGLIEGYGYKSNVNGVESVEGLYNNMLADLDVMAFTYANQFNIVHQSGWSPNEIRNGADVQQDFFSFGVLQLSADNPKGAAANIRVSQAILDDVDNIAAAAEGNVLSGVMVRKPTVNSGTIGNPIISGIYDKTVAEAAVPGFNNAEKVNISLKYESGAWSYKLTAADSNGTPLNPELSHTGQIDSTEKSISIFGVNIDLSSMSAQQNGDEWSFEFNADGVKSADEAFIGNGSNALKLAEVKDAILNYGGSLTNVQTFYQGMIGTLGDIASEANRMVEVSATLSESVDKNRMSISSVSLDEEMTDMIKFQHAYNAAARNITMIDEMLDKIINGMGVVGR